MGEYGKTSKTSQDKKRAIKVICKFNKALFKKYIEPNLETIKSLVTYYSDNKQEVDDNYIYTLEEFAKGINTYNPTQPLDTWIHACVKHSCFRQNKKRSNELSHKTGLSLDMVSRSTTSAPFIDPDKSHISLIDSISDEVYDALMQIPPIKLSPFLAQAQGYTLNEIVEMEYETGNLESKSVHAIKARIFWTRDKLRTILGEYGFRKQSKKN